MLEPFEDYFKEIEMPTPLRKRAPQLCNDFTTILPGKPERVFITDAYDSEGVRRYHSLWVVSGNVISEFKNFAIQDNVDFVNLSCGVRWLDITKTDLKEITGPTSTKSMLIIEASFGEGIGSAARMQAVHNNCAHLAKLIKDVFLPRLK
jgi:hypothetical protein